MKELSTHYRNSQHFYNSSHKSMYVLRPPLTPFQSKISNRSCVSPIPPPIYMPIQKAQNNSTVNLQLATAFHALSEVNCLSICDGNVRHPHTTSIYNITNTLFDIISKENN